MTDASAFHKRALRQLDMQNPTHSGGGTPGRNVLLRPQVDPSSSSASAPHALWLPGFGHGAEYSSPFRLPTTAAPSSALIQGGQPVRPAEPWAPSEPPESSTVTASAVTQKSDWRTRRKEERKKTGMAEPRARAARHKGQMNFAPELRLLLLAYGDPSPHHSFPQEPLPETVRVLDEIVTDFVLEMCHAAAAYASYARRQKIKVDDFRFALRRDPGKLGRVQELLRMERELKEARKAFDQNDDQVGTLKETGKRGLEEAGESMDETTTTGAGKKSKSKGKKSARRGSDATEETVSKKRKVAG
ncbi:hypothetical protein VTN96DRAFT_8236 [Rasamsonia emersonii]